MPDDINIPQTNNNMLQEDPEKVGKWKLYLKGKLKWLIWLIIILLLTIAIYVPLHESIKGSRSEKISAEDIVNITTIINNQDNVLRKLLADTNIKNDSTKKFILLYQDTAKYKIKNYFIDRYDSKLSDSIEIYRILKDKNFDEMKTIIPTLTIPFKSFFWLSDEKKYLEVIFWALFGVLCSLIYFCSEYIKDGTFQVQELPVYLAKLFYAPFIAVAIFFGYKQLTSTPITIDETSYGLLFFSYILGFYSGRALELLNRIKDAIIPGQGPLPTTPPEVTYSIEGTVFTPELTDDEKKNLNLNNVKINLTSTDNKTMQTTKPDEGWKYKFDKLKEGTYTLKASYTSQEGVKYESDQVKCVLTKDKPNLTQDIELIKIN